MRHVFSATVLLAACEPFVAHHPVKPDDEAAWLRAPTIELEKHPVFSTLEREERTLSDGTIWWIFHDCQQHGMQCRSGSFSAPNGVTVGQTTCSGAGVSCCHHQFTVKDAVVTEYHARGSCSTYCGMRPPEAAKVCTY